VNSSDEDVSMDSNNKDVEINPISDAEKPISLVSKPS
jgi:hypothetical protein